MASDSNLPYQGYPYINPMVTDAPSIDAETAARWNNLPRKKLVTKGKNVPEPAPVVYIDIPGTAETDDSPQRIHYNPLEEAERPEQDNSTNPTPSSNEPLDNPDTIFYDPFQNKRIVPPRREQDSSNDSTPLESPQATIFYDPFKDTRIQMPRDDRDGNSGSSPSLNRPSRPAPSRPIPPCTLDVASGSSGPSSNLLSPSALPFSLEKESNVYGRPLTPQTDDGFPLGPIPVSEFPEPPPSYMESNRQQQSSVPTPSERYSEQHRPQQPPVMDQPRPQPSYPPTQVIVSPPLVSPTTYQSQGPALPGGIPRPDRKNLFCHHCSYRVHTLVIRESGPVTHVIAFSFLLLCMLPITAAIYCTNCCKYKNHYCPNCNELIGYEFPMLCQKLVYVKK